MTGFSRLLFASSVLALGTSLACTSTTSTSGVPTDTTTVTWKQVWSDEFDGPSGTAPDPTKWNYDPGDGCSSGICGWGNNEKEYYTSARENISLNGNGQLMIVARLASSNMTCYYGPCRYTSAKITTRGKMDASPGRVEARIKLPSGQGLWPAFWMLGSSFPSTPWPACGEFDIMENHGSASSGVSSAVHGPGYSGNTPFARGYTLGQGTFSDDFHVFAVEWNAIEVQFSVDNVSYHAVARGDMERFGKTILDQSFFVILNLAVGGNFDSDPRSDEVFPATMLVDYVRVYVPQVTK